MAFEFSLDIPKVIQDLTPLGLVELLFVFVLVYYIDVPVLLGGRRHLPALTRSRSVGPPHSEAALRPLLILGWLLLRVQIRYHLDPFLGALEAVPVDLEVCSDFGDMVDFGIYLLDFAMVVFLFHVLGAIVKPYFGLGQYDFAHGLSRQLLIKRVDPDLLDAIQLWCLMLLILYGLACATPILVSDLVLQSAASRFESPASAVRGQDQSFRVGSGSEGLVRIPFAGHGAPILIPPWILQRRLAPVTLMVRNIL